MKCSIKKLFIRTLENDTYIIYEPLDVRLLNRLHLGFSKFKKHKPLMSPCPLETEDTDHYFCKTQNSE